MHKFLNWFLGNALYELLIAKQSYQLSSLGLFVQHKNANSPEFHDLETPNRRQHKHGLTFDNCSYVRYFKLVLLLKESQSYRRYCEFVLQYIWILSVGIAFYIFLACSISGATITLPPIQEYPQLKIIQYLLRSRMCLFLSLLTLSWLFMRTWFKNCYK